MVFPSIRLYLDPPNWQQQEPNQHLLQANGSTDEQNSAHQMLPPLPPQAQDPQVGSIMAGSMADRAQIAKIPPPDTTLKCPRCESTNTKFCYFNNYSLSQPRHFCKTCRRYWTRGGALRNVPVGGGCRRNKKSKKGQGRSKSPASAAPSSTTEKHSPSSLLLPIHNSVPSSATCQELIGRFSSQQPSSNRGFMASLQNMSRYGTVGSMGQNELMGFQIGGGGVEPWRLQQFPSLLSGFESSNCNNNNSVASCAASYPFHQGVSSGGGGLVGVGVGDHQMAPPVKVELGSGNNNNLNLMMSGGSESNQYYSWTDHLSGLASSSAHLL